MTEVVAGGVRGKLGVKKVGHDKGGSTGGGGYKESREFGLNRGGPREEGAEGRQRGV